ncbi:polar amino acid transport system substrate-binding protein [Janthinobacterium sp. CG_23.3]|uniref:hypothetical protein n=1 Tax=Janthinobacterium sp. CG_23.3 TaxID=3349634 RepID=UPI0038D36738
MIQRPARPLLSRLALACGVLGLSASCLARTVSVCIPTNPFPPLTFTDHDGQGQWLVRKALALQGDQVQFAVVPWLRCTEGVMAGAYDAALPPSAIYAASMAFPMGEGQVDTQKAVGTVTMVVLRRIGSKANWDGKAFSALSTPVMFNKGIVSVREKLAKLGVQGDEGAQANESLLRKLLVGRGDLLVMNGLAAANELANGDMAGELELLPAPFLSFTLYLAFNRDFQQAHPAYVNAVWSEIGRLRASPEFIKLAPALAK